MWRRTIMTTKQLISQSKRELRIRSAEVSLTSKRYMVELYELESEKWTAIVTKAQEERNIAGRELNLAQEAKWDEHAKALEDHWQNKVNGLSDIISLYSRKTRQAWRNQENYNQEAKRALRELNEIKVKP